MEEQLVISIFGSGGGVAKAVLSVLDHSIADPDSPLYHRLTNSRIHCIDQQQRPLSHYNSCCPNLAPSLKLHQFDLNDRSKLLQHLQATGTQLVVDLSWADTITVMECCNELGIAYVNTALENKEVDDMPELESFTLIERSIRFEEARDSFTRLKAIIGSGMNPGIVQWMAHKLIGMHPEEQPLGCYIVERDSTFYADRSLAEAETIYSTWSADCFLDEAVLNLPMFVSKQTPLFLYYQPFELEFDVTLGAIQFKGCLMPHEESITIARQYGVESGFIYQVNDVTTAAIREHLNDSDVLWDWKQKVLDPADGELSGEDLVGVLLVYKDKERYMYNVSSSETIYPLFGTNATYWQVACGVYGAISTLLLDAVAPGVYWVDELLKTYGQECRYGDYLSYYMSQFVIGSNDKSEGMLLDRMHVWTEEEGDSYGG